MKVLITISLDVNLQSPQKRKAALLGKKSEALAGSSISHTSKKWLSMRITFIFSMKASLLPLNY